MSVSIDSYNEGSKISKLFLWVKWKKDKLLCSTD